MQQTTKTMRIEIVSAEKEIFSGEVDSVTAMGEAGEVGISPGHTPLLAPLKPGEIRLYKDGKEDSFYVSSGILEVQPHLVTVLADTVARAADLDELAAIQAKERAEKALSDKKSDIDFNMATAELAEAMAQLRLISKFRDKLK
jgi:F-type H+-transporting ATPase subunit epsilon